MSVIPFEHMDRDLTAKAVKLANSINNQIPNIIGQMLVEGFKKSFELQRFNDDGEAKWQEVKRREKGNDWYGFNLGTNGRVPRGSRELTKTGKAKQFGTRGGKTNFSSRATTRGILFGSGSSNLRDSIILSSANRARIIISSDQPHAEVHNEGLQALIFGKKRFQMPKRLSLIHI